MKSTNYYVPNSPKYSSTVNDNAWKPSSLQSKVPSPATFSDSTPNFGLMKGPIAVQGQLGGVSAASDPLERFTAGKTAILESAIQQVMEEIEARETLHDELVEEIDKQFCIQKEALMQVAPNGNSPFTVGDPKRRGSIEKELCSLDSEKRHEQVAIWKDVASLNREFRELLRELEEEKRKQQVMHG
jgi:hypothetical protein